MKYCDGGTGGYSYGLSPTRVLRCGVTGAGVPVLSPGPRGVLPGDPADAPPGVLPGTCPLRGAATDGVPGDDITRCLTFLGSGSRPDPLLDDLEGSSGEISSGLNGCK